MTPLDGRGYGYGARRLALLAPLSALGLACVAAAFATASGCTWDYTAQTTTDDATTDGELDTPSFPDTYTLPDGRVCSGHDEDQDGVPDECDNCPNVFNPDQEVGSATAVGARCAPAKAFIAAPSRLLFDPFTSLDNWKLFGSGSGVFSLGPEGDSLVGGSLGEELPFVVGSVGAGASAAVATTTMTIVDEATTAPFGSAGLLLRVSSDAAKKFYLCAVSYRNGFALARAPDGGCNGGLCAPLTFSMPPGDGGTPVPAQLPIPADIPHKLGDTIGIRMSVTASMGDGGILGDIECRVFDPKRPETLTSTDSKYALKATAGGLRWFPAGEVGLYSQRARAVFGSIDVLRGP